MRESGWMKTEMKRGGGGKMWRLRRWSSRLLRGLRGGGRGRFFLEGEGGGEMEGFGLKKKRGRGREGERGIFRFCVDMY